MTSQVRHNFQASQAVDWADDVPTPIILSQVDNMSGCCPQVDTRNSYNFDFNTSSYLGRGGYKTWRSWVLSGVIFRIQELH